MPDPLPRHFLNPCTIFAHREEHLVTTVLGSCIAVCLWEASSGLGGINHYMLPLWNGDGLPTPKYGNVAIAKLIERMERLGARPERLVAKAFGGANVLGSGRGYYDVGRRNIQICEELLARHRIMVVSSDLGGEVGRKIVFNTRTGLVQVSWLAAGERNLPDGKPQASRPAPPRRD
jgi:chemotaxis protein CheD